MAKSESPKLSDVIGGLVASVAHARGVADVEALRIAYRYRSNEFLKGLPVPRLRLRRVSLSLPVIVTEVIPGEPAKANDTSEVARVAADALANAIQKASAEVRDFLGRPDLTTEQERTFKSYDRLLKFAIEMNYKEDFRSALEAQLKHALLDLRIREGGTATSDAAIREVLAQTAEATFREKMKEISFQYVRKRGEDLQQSGEEVEPFDPDRARRWAEETVGSDIIERLINVICDEVERVAIINPTKSPDFYVSVDTDSIKNAGGGPDAVTRLSMVLLEEGLEWVSEVRGDGVETTRLIPE